MNGGTANPEAETHVSIVWVLPLSADVIAHTLRLPN